MEAEIIQGRMTSPNGVKGMREKVRCITYSNRDMWIDYRNNIEKGSMYDIPVSVYKDISKIGNAYVAERLLEESDILYLPFNMGRLYIGKSKPSKKIVNFHDTLEIGKTVQFANLHTDSYIMRTCWVKPRRREKFCHYIGYYKFEFVREFKKRLCRILRVGGKDYLPVSSKYFALR